MRSRKLGKTGLNVSELSLGTWGLSGGSYGPIPEAEVGKVIERALAMGINLFETSHSYGKRKMETALGEVLTSEEHIVVTKWGTDLEGTPQRKRFDAKFLRASAEESRERLGEKVKVIGLLHNPSSQALEDGEGVATLKELAEEGTIHTWGISAGTKEVAKAAIEAKAPIISFAHNILHVSTLRAVEEELKAEETGVLAHSVLFYGLLTGRWAPSKSFRNQDHRSERWGPGALRSRIQDLNALRPLISGEVTSLRSAAVRFVLTNPLISSAVLGPRSCAHLDQLVRECRGGPPYLSPAKLTALENRLEELEVER